MSVKFSVGVDLGSGNTAVSVFHHGRQCAIPLEIGDAKIMPTCIAISEGGEECIVGRRAFTRPARLCDGILCAYRQMMYGQEPAWALQRTWCHQKWHFDVEDGGDELAKKTGGGYKVRGRVITVKDLIAEVIEVVCTYLLEAVRPGGKLEVGSGEQVSFVNFGLSVAECFTPGQRELVLATAQGVVSRRLSAATRCHVVSDTLASAVQICSMAPFTQRNMLIVDFGASKLSVSLYSFEQSQDEDMAFVVREVVSRTNVFVGGDEMEYRMLKWCEDRKPFPESLLASKSATFKLRREVRQAIKTLTVAEEAMIDVDHLLPEKDLIVMLRLEDFERECSDIFESVGELVDEVVRAGQMGFPEEVVLVGGCTRVPRVQKVLGRMAAAAGSTIRKTLDLDRAVSLGVATVCALTSDPAAVRVPLERANPFFEQPDRIQENFLPGHTMQRERSSFSSDVDLGSGDVMSLRALCKQLRRQNASLLESESRLRGQLLLNQDSATERHDGGISPAQAGGAPLAPPRGGGAGGAGGGDARLQELLERCRTAEEVARVANQRANQLSAEKEQLEGFAERRVRAAEEAAGDLRHKMQNQRKDLQKGEWELRRLREEVASLRRETATAQAKALRFEEELARSHADFHALKRQLQHLHPNASGHSRTPSAGTAGDSPHSFSRASYSFNTADGSVGGGAGLGYNDPDRVDSPGANKSSAVSQAFIPEQGMRPTSLNLQERGRVTSLPARPSSGGTTERSYAARQLRRFWNLSN